MLKNIETIINIVFIIAIIFIAPGMVQNGHQINSDAMNYWLGGNSAISESIKVQSMKDFENQPVTKAESEAALKSIFED